MSRGYVGSDTPECFKENTTIAVQGLQQHTPLDMGGLRYIPLQVETAEFRLPMDFVLIKKKS